eukprot:7380739-Prymnesium_polylepis.1
MAMHSLSTLFTAPAGPQRKIHARHGRRVVADQGWPALIVSTSCQRALPKSRQCPEGLVCPAGH